MSASKSNPFRDLRLKQGISQYELARRIDCSKHAVLRLEQGMYFEPLPSVIEYFIGYYPNLTRLGLISDYHEFQIMNRAKNARLLGDISLELRGLPVGKHPLTYLREGRGLNLTEVAKKLCISQSTIGYFEKSPIHQKTVPQQLIEALWDADYTEQETYDLVESYLTYREHVTEIRSSEIKSVNPGVNAEVA